jgi:hypothetical protein
VKTPRESSAPSMQLEQGKGRYALETARKGLHGYTTVFRLCNLAMGEKCRKFGLFLYVVTQLHELHSKLRYLPPLILCGYTGYTSYIGMMGLFFPWPLGRLVAEDGSDRAGGLKLWPECDLYAMLRVSPEFAAPRKDR